MRVEIKALSANDCWRGRRFKTDDYKQYEKDVFRLLPKLNIPKGIKLELYLKVSFSSSGSDIDNAAKPFIDIMQKKYKFNDSQIYRLIMDKNIVPKGKECIEFDIKEY